MRRPITIAQPLSSWPRTAERFRADPGTWLPDPRANGPMAWLCSVGPDPGPVAGSIGHLVPTPHRRVRCEVGEVWSNSRTLHRRIVWSPLTEDADLVAADRFLPALEGHLHLTRAAGGCSLVLDGEVSLPLGPVGAALDAVGLRRVGDRTVTAFVRAVAARLDPHDADAALDPGAALAPSVPASDVVDLSRPAAPTIAGGHRHRPGR